MNLRVMMMVMVLLAGCPARQEVACVEEGACGADDPDGHTVYTTACEQPERLIKTCVPGGAPAPACSAGGNGCEVGSACTDNRQCESEMCAVEGGEIEGVCIATTSHYGEVCPPNHRVAEESDTDPTAVCLPTPCDDASCRIVEVATSFNRHCMRVASGAVYCWRDGEAPGAPLTGIDDGIDLDGAIDRLCVVRRNGETVCMDGDQPPAPFPLSGVVQLALGVSHHCGVTAGGEVRCLGTNDFGQLGDGSFGTTFQPVTVVGLADAVEVVVGREHSCALRQGGQVVCWGRAAMLGAERPNDIAVPVAVLDVNDATDLAIGTTTCAVRGGGAVSCWNWTPVAMPALPPMSRLEGGSFGLADGRIFGFVCGVLTSGGAQCWGTGDIPANGTDPLVPQPNAVQEGFDGPAAGWESRPLADVADLARTQIASCALLTSGEVRCGTTTLRPGPAPARP